MANLDQSLLSHFTPEQQRAMRSVFDSINNIAAQTNAEPLGQTPPPEAHSSLNVTGGNGYFKVEIAPSNNNYRGAENFVEASEDPNFKPGTVHLEHLGASTTGYFNYGEKNLHFRSFCQHDTSAPSEPVYCRNVSGVGGTAPAMGGKQPGLTGYGQQMYQGNTPPKRRSM